MDKWMDDGGVGHGLELQLQLDERHRMERKERASNEAELSGCPVAEFITT